MKKNILNVILALCIVSFSTVAKAQSTSAKQKNQVKEVTPPDNRPQKPIAVPVEEMMKDQPPPPISNEPRQDEVFQVVEQQAEFAGGQASLFNWLAANIKYPAVARENNIQGKVILRFIIEKNGSVTGVTVLRGTNNLLDAEAVRVVKSMPNWKAGKQRGNDVRSYFTLPVVFKLETAAPSTDKK
jgi:periplasmic protein TonB